MSFSPLKTSLGFGF